MSNPRVSIVFITSDHRARAEASLERVLCQEGFEQAEVLLYDLGAGRFASLRGSDHAAVRVMQLPPHPGLHNMRADAARLGRGQVIAFVDDHTLVQDGWLQALLDDFDQGYAGVAAVATFKGARSGATDLLEIMQYMAFETIQGRQEVPALPGHNLAYRRDVLLAFGDELDDLLACDVLLEERIRARGLKLLLDPAVGFVHLNVERTSDLYSVFYLHDRNFGAHRARLNHWGMRRCILQLLAVPAIPFMRLARATAELRRTSPAKLRLLKRHLGVYLVCQLCGALGLGVGAVFGAGEAGWRFAQCELNWLHFSAPET